MLSKLRFRLIYCFCDHSIYLYNSINGGGVTDGQRQKLYQTHVK